MTSDRWFLVIGAVLALIAVAGGAFGAHALRDRVSADLLAAFETAVRYQMYHALGLFGVGLAMSRWPAPQLTAAGWLFVLGTVIFSGSLYLLVLSGARWWGAVTPVGGLCLLAGWSAVVWGILSHR